MKEIFRRARESGFTLVELLIVIALIAILSVAVLATINPIEQANKAKDATTQNDAAEVMNGYERYYANQQSYPWMDVDSSATVTSVDEFWFGTSDYNGAGLCTLDVQRTPNTRCASYNANPGLLISQDELKPSFLEKGYTSLVEGDPKYNVSGMNYLWIDKKPSAEYNSIYVCYIPSAKSNRASTNNLKKWNATSDGFVSTVTGDFINGQPIAAYTFLTPANSLFKCVP